jgi:Transglutaminase-like superfamily
MKSLVLSSLKFLSTLVVAAATIIGLLVLLSISLLSVLFLRLSFINTLLLLGLILIVIAGATLYCLYEVIRGDEANVPSPVLTRIKLVARSLVSNASRTGGSVCCGMIQMARPRALTFLLAGIGLVLLVASGLLRHMNHKAMQNYAAQLPKSLASGADSTMKLISSTKGLASIERLRIHYQELSSKWKYVPDQPGQDAFKPVGDALSGDYWGDCEDLAACLVSIAKALGAESHVVLGQSSARGHAWAEVLVSDNRDLPEETHKRLIEEFGDSADVILRSDGRWWLRLSPKGSLDGLRETCLIDVNGSLQPIGVRRSLRP